MGSIQLHPEYGVNPSMDLCFWCGEAKGIALLGRNKGKEAPRSVVTGYDPCNACKEQMAHGIALIECAHQNHFPDRPPIREGIVPTGRWIVVREDALDRVFDEGMAAALKKARKGFVEMGPAFDMLLPEETK